MTKLSVDLETFSSVDISKCGMYKYVQSPDFEVLLFAYAFDDDPVQQIDFACGEPIPRDLPGYLLDAATVKKAWNAPFEWYCLSKAFSIHEPLKWLPQWHDTMVEALYCGYPAKLELAGPAVGLPEEKQKLTVGHALIKYFCVPCEPTQRNGGRTRNLPQHDAAKWELFKTYNRQDVETERTIGEAVSSFPVPEEEWRNWRLDQEINLRGVRIDHSLIAGAQYCDEQMSAVLMDEARRLTGLDNPGSTSQLRPWLAVRGVALPDLRKETVAEAVKTVTDPTVRRVLQLRQDTSKASIAKYQAMVNGACADDRVRGLTQFYGAQRTGRWCLTGDHEVLTPNGWTRLDKWLGGPIACWSPSTEYMSFQNAESLSFDYSGEMISVIGQRCEQICTPDHKMPFLGKSGGWTYAPMKDISQHRFTIPFTGRRLGAYSPEPDKLRVLIMTQADGHYAPGGDLRFHFHKTRKIERCKHLLRKCNIPFQISAYSDGNSTLTIKSRAMPLWLRQFQNKTFNYWLLDESPDIIFDELPLWDGYACGPNSVQYTSTNLQNAEILQAAAILSGRSATLLTKRRDRWNTTYILNIWNTPGHGTAIRREQVSRTDYTGKVYCAKTKTGFFVVRRNGKVWITGNSGRFVQTQNLPRKQAKFTDLARETVRAKELPALRLLYPSVPDTLSQLIRTALIPALGHKFVVADFSAIEARVIAWWAGESWRQKIFAGDGKIYEASAASMFGVPIETIGHDKDGNDLGNYALRQKGKIAELALGYQGSIGAMKNMGADKMGLSDAELLDIVQRWRKASPRIVDLWYACESAAIDSIKTGRINMVNRFVAFGRQVDQAHGRDFMVITLPSGRQLFYDHPRLVPGERGEKITYQGVHQKTHKWGTLETYGGKLVENCVQAIARDCLALTMQRLSGAGFRPVFHVHDEVINEEPVGRQNALDEACAIMAIPIPWAPGLLLRAAGFEDFYYRKD